jgi:predicted phosphodiesterase
LNDAQVRGCKRVAAIYDIHANLPALEAVLDDVRRARVDAIVVGGDVLPGPMPRDVLARLRDVNVPTRCIRGNGEAAVLAHLAGGDLGNLPATVRETIRWVASQLTPIDMSEIAAGPPTTQLDVASLGPVLFCHATPRSDTEIFTRSTDEARLAPAFAGVEQRVVICGHTHMQFDRTVGSFRVVNAGSVGMPYGDPGAYWLLLSDTVELRRTEYDLVAAAERIRATDYPGASEFAAVNVMHPPSERDMLALLASAELR